MSTFLLFVPLPKDHAALGERLVRTAVSFLETQGAVERADLGDFERGGRKDAPGEALALVSLRASNGGADAQTRARTLEGVLRATLTAAGVRAGDVRVFVAAA
jgi:hypothetical protein